MFEKLEGVEERYSSMEARLGDPEVIQDRDRYQRYVREHSELGKIVEVVPPVQRNRAESGGQQRACWPTGIRKSRAWPRRKSRF